MNVLGDYVPVMKNRKFVSLWLAQAISNFGDAIARIALLVLITQNSDSPLALTLVIGVQALPAIFIGPIAGVYVDRLSNKRLMICMDIVRTIAVLGIVFSNSSWQIYVFSFILGAASSVYTPARTALVPEVVGEELFIPAKSLTQSTYQAMTLIGPAIGGVLVAILGVRIAFVIDALTFIIAGIIIALTALPNPPANTSSDFTGDLKEGFRTIITTPQLNFLLSILTIFLLIVGGYSVLLVDYVNNVLQASPAQFGIVQSSMAVGLLTTGLILGYLNKKINRGRLIFNSMVGIGLCSLYFFTSPAISAVIVWGIALGAADGCADLPIASLLIEYTPKATRGRVLSVYAAIVRVAALIGLSLAGPLAQWFGSGTVIAWMGLVIIVVGGLGRFLPAYSLLNTTTSKTMPIKT